MAKNRAHELIVHLDVPTVLVPSHSVPVRKEIVDRVSTDDADSIRHEENVVGWEERISIRSSSSASIFGLVCSVRISASPSIGSSPLAIGVDSSFGGSAELSLDCSSTSLVCGTPDCQDDSEEGCETRFLGSCTCDSGSAHSSRSASSCWL